MDYNHPTNGTSSYFYITNLQGDVLQIRTAGMALVANYAYNAFGEPVHIKDANGNDVSGNATHIANLNPLRYRGYVYDPETGFYVTATRYYDPVVGRFINADGYASTGQGFLGYNMFAYCNNNPVNYRDCEGEKSKKNKARQKASLSPAPPATPRTSSGVPLPRTVPLPRGGQVTWSAARWHPATRIQFIRQAQAHQQRQQQQQAPVQPRGPWVQQPSTGRGANHLQPNPNAGGAHTTFRRDSATGRITHYETMGTESKESIWI